MNKSITDKTYSKKFGRTICEVHREIHDELYDNLQDHPSYEMLLAKLEEAYGMAKKMDAKLRQYKNNYDDNWWEKEKVKIVDEKIEKRFNRK